MRARAEQGGAMKVKTRATAKTDEAKAQQRSCRYSISGSVNGESGSSDNGKSSSRNSDGSSSRNNGSSGGAVALLLSSLASMSGSSCLGYAFFLLHFKLALEYIFCTYIYS